LTGRNREQEELEAYERMIEEDKTDFQKAEEAQQAKEKEAQLIEEANGYHWVEGE
jgi:hypothetical protein